MLLNSLLIAIKSEKRGSYLLDFFYTILSKIKSFNEK